MITLTEVLVENLREGGVTDKIRIADVNGVKYLIEVNWKGEWHEVGELDQAFVELEPGNY